MNFTNASEQTFDTDFRHRPHTGFVLRNDDTLNITALLRRFKEKYLTDNFLGGEITLFSAGGEVDLSHSDLQGVSMIDLTVTLGGIKLITPPTWQIVNDVDLIFAGIEDKRSNGHNQVNGDKILILKGTCLFGGVEITS